jgi:hypothetical protein
MNRGFNRWLSDRAELCKEPSITCIKEIAASRWALAERGGQDELHRASAIYPDLTQK